MVETLRINSGEYVGLSILRITTIPHLSILTDDQSVQGLQCAVIKAGQDFSGMLTEAYQQYKDSFLQTGSAGSAATWLILDCCMESTDTESAMAATDTP